MPQTASIPIRIFSSATREHAACAARAVTGRSVVDDLDLKLNRASESTVPCAKQLFWGATSQMMMDDVQAIYKALKGAATQYFSCTMSDPVRETMRPVVDQTLQQVGAGRSFDDTIAR